MSILFAVASTEYLEVNATPVTAPPFTMACWFYADANTAAYSLMSLADQDVDDHYHQIVLRGDLASDPILATSRNSSGTPSASTSTGYSLNTWHHACGIWAATNSRAVYVDGGSVGTDSTVCATNNMDRTSIGRLGDRTPTRYMSGRIAEAAIWNVALTAAEVATLANGISPLQVRKASLVAYYRCIDVTDLNDLIGAGDMTAYNTPASAEHAPVMYFNGVVFVPETAGGTEVDNSRDAVITGKSTSNSERNAVITGKLASNSERNTVITGKSVSNSERNAIIIGNQIDCIDLTWSQRSISDIFVYDIASDSDGSNLVSANYNAEVGISKDGGISWTYIDVFSGGPYCVASDNDGSNLIVGTSTRLYISTDGGDNWDEVQPAGDVNRNWLCVASDADGSNLIAGNTIGRLYTSSDGGENWIQRYPIESYSKYWQSVCSDSDGSVLLASNNSLDTGTDRLYISTNSGVDWSEVRPTGDVNGDWRGIASDADGSYIVAGEYGGRLYISTNLGVNWSEIRPAGDVDRNWFRVRISSDGSAVVAIDYYDIVGTPHPPLLGYVWISRDSGITWCKTFHAHELGILSCDDDASNLAVSIWGTSANYHIWTVGGLITNSERDAVITGGIISTSERSAVIAGKLGINSERSAVITGKSAVSSERNAVVTGKLTSNSERNAVITGGIISSSERDAVITGKTITNSERDAVIIGKSVSSSDRNAIISGKLTSDSERGAIITGGLIVNSERSAVVTGKTSIGNERGAVITGKLTSNSERNAIITGGVIVNSERDAIIVGKSISVSERNAVISGKLSISSERNAVITGKSISNSERGAVITGGLIVNSERDAIISGKIIISDERNAILNGKDISNSERGAVITGKLTSNSERGAVITGGIVVNSERDAVITGKAISTSERNAIIAGKSTSDSERNAVITGKLSDNSERNAIITGKLSSYSERNAIIIGKLSISSERNAIITGKLTSNSERDAIIIGGIVSTSERNAIITGKSSTFSERNATIKVEGSVSSERLAIITGFLITNSERDAVIHGSIDVSSERSAVIHGKNIGNSERDAVIHGKLSDNSDRNAVIHGKDTANSERNAVIHGKDTANSERDAVIRGKLEANSERNAKIHGKALAVSERYCTIIGEGITCTSGRLGIRTYIREKKTYAQVSDKNGNYLGVIPEIIDVQFSSIMNGGSANMTISIPEEIEDIETNQLYNGGNQVVIWVQDRDTPSGVRIYCGLIGIVQGTVRGNAEYVELGIEGYTSEFEKTPYIDSGDASIQHTDQLPSDVFKSIVDKYRAFRDNPHMNYSASSVDSIGVSYLITYPFNHKNCFEALNVLMESCPVDWYWYLDNEGILYFKQISNIPDHLFTFGRDIVDEFSFQKSYGNIRTGILFWNNEAQTASDRTRLVFRQTAVDDYDKNIQIVNDGNITRWDTFARITEKYLDSSSQPLSAVSFIIFDNNSGIGYDIESIKPGDTCRILNLSSNLDIGENLIITTTEYHLDYIKVVVEDRRQFITRQLMDINRRLNNQEYSSSSYKVGIGTYEMGKMTVNKDLVEIAYRRKYKDPILVACMNTYNDSEESNVIADITGNEDEQVIKVRVIETPENTDDHANESVAYMLVETGTGYLPSGIYFEANKVEENDGNFSSVAFSETFVNTPVVLCSYQTSDGHYCNVRIQNRTTAGFQVKLENAQGDSTTINGTIYWIALDMTSDNTFLPIDLEVPTDVQGISDGWKTVTWTQTWSNNPLIFHQIQTYSDTDPCSSRIKELGTTDVKVVCEEDKNSGPEQNHNAETVALIGFPYNNSDGIT